MACTPLLSEDDLYRFRTKQCLRIVKGSCEFGQDRCQYSHSAEWIRRCPYYISLPSYLRYIPVSCPFGKREKNESEEDKEKIKNIFRNSIHLTNKDGSVNNNFYKYIEEKNINKCPLGVECPLAHTKEEIDYHPLVYKTKRCEYFKNANCNRYYCPNLHGLAEQRKIKEYFIPFSSKIDIPPYPNVTIVKKIQYGSFKGQNQIRNNTKKTNSLQQGFNNSCSFYFNSTSNKNQNQNQIQIQNLKNIDPVSIGKKMHKHIDLKHNSINIPCHEKKLSFQYCTNNDQRHSTCCCDRNFMTYENSLIKKKKKNSIFTYLNNYDDKYTLYLRILKKFLYLFDLDISDINSKASLNSSHGELDVCDHFLDANKTFASAKTTDSCGYMLTKNNVPSLSTKDMGNVQKNSDHSDLSTTNEPVEMKHKSSEEKMDYIFLNNKYCDILNHIFKKNLEITKNKIKVENESTEMELTDNLQKNSSSNNNTLPVTFFKNHTTQEGTNTAGNNETYESFLNLLSHVLCLLYFTTDSRAHWSFDLYTHELAKRLHCESKKMRNISMEKYLTNSLKEMI
ncbi:D13 protein [Plasmodium gonderi]|uniref:D13 protein n=1 Tax=Plasmodium gonderi TaxID=77519 RepID=A0A1Y1JB56_PLAGO|nr:D13 protein [Plasmodium gonderi]GAW79726.1 D13 protein [Plasmodium gonderi]